MEFDQYVAARYGRLIEHAVALGCADTEAHAHVDRVLLEQRRRIRRAEDPDPLVHDALDRAITGVPGQRFPGALAVLGAVAVAVAIGGTVATPPPDELVPSLFAMTGPQASQLLEDRGYDVEVEQSAFCDPQGLVLGSDPPVGQPAPLGATVTVRTARPTETTCHGQFVDRVAAWQFVSFALGGRPPTFAPTFTLIIDTEAAVTLTRVEAEDLARWGGFADLVSEAARGRATTENGMPALHVSRRVPPVEWCKTPRPAPVADRTALRIEVDRQTRNDEGNCPLTIDLYRTGDAIDSVVLYRAKFEPGELAFAGVS